MNPHTHFTALARYNVWATKRLLNAIALLSDGDYRRDVGLFFKSVHGTLNHILMGEHLVWYPRFAEGESPQQGAGLRHDMEVESDRSKLAQALQDGAARWTPLIESWAAEKFDAQFDYITMGGEPVSLPFAATLGHVFNHGTHHRGQITAALTALGQPGPDLDWVVLLQEQQAA